MDKILHYDDHGLIPAVLQDADTGQVLMLAWMNAEALEKTLESREAHFWSRSRQELWHKGATSGNIQRVVEIRLDCDGDALLVRVQPAGPACHTGQKSCFFRNLDAGQAEEPQPVEEDGKTDLDSPFSLNHLFEVICERRDHPSPGSYTASLFAKGEDEIVKKVGEEAIEVILAAKSQGEKRLVEEVSDLAYHSLVLLAAKGLSPDNIKDELASRHK